MQTVIENWHEVVVPEAPQLLPVKVDPAHTALLILDLQKNNCSLERRPRCVETIPGIRNFVDSARSKKLPIVYSLTSKAAPEDILDDLVPLEQDPIVKSSVDKFFGTELENILTQTGIDSVIIVGTAAEGAVLHTAAGAAMRGCDVIVPVDGMSSSTLYAEQYTVWHLMNSPGTKKRTALTRMDMISF